MKLFTLFLIIILDQISKNFINKNLPINSRYEILPFFEITNIHNTGISFGLFSGIFSQWFFIIIIGLIIIFIIYWFFNAKESMEKWALLIILSGALGNYIDRLLNNYVIDFLYFHYKDFYWPAFNVADIAITIGVFALIIDTYKNYKNRLKENNE